MGGFSTPSNGDFANNLVGWTVEGTVQETGGEAELSDTQPPHTTLWQGVAFPIGSLQVDFDFLNGLSPDVSQGYFPDTFFASVYFIDDLGTFDLVNQVYDDRAFLLDMDFGGVFNLMGSVRGSEKGGDWLHYAGQFQNNHAHAIMVFELFDLDGVAADSTVRVDNVTFAIPEPNSVMLLAVGGLVCLGRRRWRAWLGWVGGRLFFPPYGEDP
jgi:hypothetical protein